MAVETRKSIPVDTSALSELVSTIKAIELSDAANFISYAGRAYDPSCRGTYYEDDPVATLVIKPDGVSVYSDIHTGKVSEDGKPCTTRLLFNIPAREVEGFEMMEGRYPTIRVSASMLLPQLRGCPGEDDLDNKNAILDGDVTLRFIRNIKDSGVSTTIRDVIEIVSDSNSTIRYVPVYSVSFDSYTAEELSPPVVSGERLRFDKADLESIIEMAYSGDEEVEMLIHPEERMVLSVNTDGTIIAYTYGAPKKAKNKKDDDNEAMEEQSDSTLKVITEPLIVSNRFWELACMLQINRINNTRAEGRGAKKERQSDIYAAAIAVCIGDDSSLETDLYRRAGTKRLEMASVAENGSRKRKTHTDGQEELAFVRTAISDLPSEVISDIKDHVVRATSSYLTHRAEEIGEDSEYAKEALLEVLKRREEFDEFNINENISILMACYCSSTSEDAHTLKSLLPSSGTEELRTRIRQELLPILGKQLIHAHAIRHLIERGAPVVEESITPFDKARALREVLNKTDFVELTKEYTEAVRRSGKVNQWGGKLLDILRNNAQRKIVANVLEKEYAISKASVADFNKLTIPPAYRTKWANEEKEAVIGKISRDEDGKVILVANDEVALADRPVQLNASRFAEKALGFYGSKGIDLSWIKRQLAGEQDESSILSFDIHSDDLEHILNRITGLVDYTNEDANVVFAFRWMPEWKDEEAQIRYLPTGESRQEQILLNDHTVSEDGKPLYRLVRTDEEVVVGGKTLKRKVDKLEPMFHKGESGPQGDLRIIGIGPTSLSEDEEGITELHFHPAISNVRVKGNEGLPVAFSLSKRELHHTIKHVTSKAENIRVCLNPNGLVTFVVPNKRAVLMTPSVRSTMLKEQQQSLAHLFSDASNKDIAVAVSSESVSRLLKSALLSEELTKEELEEEYSILPVPHKPSGKSESLRSRFALHSEKEQTVPNISALPSDNIVEEQIKGGPEASTMSQAIEVKILQSDLFGSAFEVTFEQPKRGRKGKKMK